MIKISTFMPQPSAQLQNVLLRDVAEGLLQFLGPPGESEFIHGRVWEC